MTTTLPNSGIVIPDAGNTNWYALFVSLMTLLDTISAPDDYTVPASSQHAQASMAALFDDIYSTQLALKRNVQSGFGFGTFGSGGFGR